ncbi:MAG: type IX secretion system membrane protein PorP/SprF [Elusimicrobia bacterium]|nr:type IX secretion system membrane protein PorP/SprF [Elusimicrobiota bacterium]
MNKQKPISANYGVRLFFFLITLSSYHLITLPSYALFDDLGMGARGPGMGNAFTAVADDINSVYYNPAGLSSVERPKVMASYTSLLSGLTDGSSLSMMNISLAVPIESGKNGAMGALWHKFGVSGVYMEQTLHASYGYKFPKNHVLEKFSVGASIKYLGHSFSRLSESYNAMDGINATNDVDPALIGENSKSAFDFDAGALYRFTNRYTFGLAVKNILQPDMSFSGASPDKIPMKIRLGASYKSLWMIMASELRMEKGPTGSMDRDVILAAERVFPSLDKGDFGIRAAFAMGTRDYKEAFAGLSYKINKIEFNYAFSMPLGTIKDTSGNHKMAMIYHFGGPTVEEQYAMDLLDQYTRLRKEQDYTGSRLVASLEDPRLSDVKEGILKENFAHANRLLMDKAKDLLPDAAVLNLSKRLMMVGNFYPDLSGTGKKTKSEEYLSSGIQHFLKGNDHKAVKQVNYSQSMNQDDRDLDKFLEQVEDMTRIKADRVPSDFNRGLIEYKFYESDILYNQKKYEDALRKLTEITDFEPENLTALKKIGSCHYLMENYNEALRHWDRARKLERDPAERQKLAEMINKTKIKATWIPEEEQKGEEKETDVRKIEKLYQVGTEFYTKGEYAKAADAFRKILSIDPENSQAKKALERLTRFTR